MKKKEDEIKKDLDMKQKEFEIRETVGKKYGKFLLKGPWVYWFGLLESRKVVGDYPK